MAGSDEVESFHDPADDFLDPESVQREHSRQVEAIEEKVAEDAADAKEGLLSRLTKRAGQSFKKGFDTVSSLVVTPPEEQEMHHDPSKKYQEEESTPAPEAAAAEAEAAAEEEDGDDPATTDEIRAEFERSADSMNRKQDETRMRIKADAEARKASLKAKLEMAREETAKKGNAGGAGEVEEEEELAPGGNNDDDDDDANLAAKMANMASVKQSEYDDAMSDALPAVSNRLDYDEAREEWKRAAVTDQEGKYIPVWRSTSADIEMLGTGIGLWFRILKAMSLYFLVMSTPVAIILGNYLYLYYNDNSDLSADTLDLLARFTTGVAATTTQSETVAGWDIRTVMFAVSAMDCFAILVFLMLVAYLKTRQNAYIEENDDAVISLPDYTVMAGRGEGVVCILRCSTTTSRLFFQLFHRQHASFIYPSIGARYGRLLVVVGALFAFWRSGALS